MCEDLTSIKLHLNISQEVTAAGKDAHLGASQFVLFSE
jgi:hypothetical protein